MSRSAPASAGAVVRSLTITFAMPRARAASVPGTIACHSSAFIPVRFIRGPTYTCRAIPAPSNPWASAKPRCCSTTGPHVSRKSAPKETM